MNSPPEPTATTHVHGAPTAWRRVHIWQIQAVRDLLVVAAAVGLVWAGYAMRSVTVPLLVALLLAYLFEPLVSWMTHRFRMSRPLAVSGLLVTIGLSVLIVLAIVIPLIIGQTMRFVHDVRAGRFQSSILRLKDIVPESHQADYERAVRWLIPTLDDHDLSPLTASELPMIDEGTTSDPVDAGIDAASQSTAADDRLRRIIREEIDAREAPPTVSPTSGSIVDLVRSSGRAIFGFLGAIVELGLLAFLIPFYFFFFSVSFPAVTQFGRELIPTSSRPKALEMIHRMDRAVAGFVRGRIVICLLMGVMLAIGWLIVGVPYSIVLGMVIGAFCLVPYLGGIGVPLAVGLLAFSQMQAPEAQRMAWWAIILWPTLVYTIVQVIESYLLTPMIAGKATNLDPVTILVAVLAGGSIGGVYGMLLAIPVAACLKIVWTDVLLPKIRAWTRGEARDPLPVGKS